MNNDKDNELQKPSSQNSGDETDFHNQVDKDAQRDNERTGLSSTGDSLQVSNNANQEDISLEGANPQSKASQDNLDEEDLSGMSALDRVKYRAQKAQEEGDDNNEGLKDYLASRPELEDIPDFQASPISTPPSNLPSLTENESKNLPIAQNPSLETQRADQSAILYFREIQSNIEVFSQQIAQGEFAQNGAGLAGRAFRSAKEADPTIMHDLWGEILAIATEMWQNEFKDESILFSQKSREEFYLPPSRKEAVDQSIELAKDAQIITIAEAAFEEGDEETAIKISNTMEDSEAANHYKHNLHQRSIKRKRYRNLAFLTAGSVIAGLLVMSFIGISTWKNIDSIEQTPRDLAIGSSIENISQELREERERTDGSIPSQADPIINPPIEQTTPVQTAPNQPNNTQPQPNTQPVQDQTNGGAQSQSQAQIAPDASNIDIETQKTECITGYVVIGMATEMATTPEETSRLNEFSSVVSQVCDRIEISPSELARGLVQVPQDRIQSIAQNILSSGI